MEKQRAAKTNNYLTPTHCAIRFLTEGTEGNLGSNKVGGEVSAVKLSLGKGENRCFKCLASLSPNITISNYSTQKKRRNCYSPLAQRRLQSVSVLQTVLLCKIVEQEVEKVNGAVRG